MSLLPQKIEPRGGSIGGESGTAVPCNTWLGQVLRLKHQFAVHGTGN